MINSSSYALEGTPRQLARVLRGTESEFLTALEDLSSTGVAHVTQRNGVVTLICRRLKREHNSRESARLRKQKSREKNTSHTKVTSAYAYASGSERKGGSGERETVELPSGFPPSVDDAIRRCAGFCTDAPFITSLWNGAMARGGMDGAGQPIRRWANYVAKHWPKEQSRRAEARAMGKPDGTTIDQAVKKNRDREIRMNLKEIERLERESRG